MVALVLGLSAATPIALLASGDSEMNLPSGPIQTDPLNEFSNRKVLAYTANQGEKIYVLDTLRGRGVRARRSGVYHKANFEGGEITIVRQGQEIPRVSGGYDIITTRGHTNNMANLYDVATEYAADNSIFILGGCQSFQFLPNLARPHRAIMAGTGTENGGQNTYTLLRVMKGIARGDSWDTFVTRIKIDSEQARDRWIFPGDPQYMRP